MCRSSLPTIQATALALLALSASGASAVAETPYDSGATPHDLVLMADARSAVRHGHFSEAIARLSTVVAQSPNFAAAYFVRAIYEADAGRFAQATADLDHTQAFHPDASEIRFVRATIALRQHDAKAALADLTEGAKLPEASLWKHVRLESNVHTMSFALAYTSVAEEMLGADDAALTSFSHELDFETERPWYVLSTHCYYAALAGLLQMAELTCGEAIARQDIDTGAFDTMGLVHLKMGKFAAAIEDYNKSLRSRPDLTLSLYGRGLARRASGDVTGGNADIAAAKAGEPDIANIMASMGVKPG